MALIPFSILIWLRATYEGGWPTPNIILWPRISIRLNGQTYHSGYSTGRPLTCQTKTILLPESGLPIARQRVAKPLFALAMVGIMVKQSLWISLTIVSLTHPVHNGRHS